MKFYVDPKYKVDIFLDTNILDDYLISNQDKVNKSLKFLSQCPYVKLISSQYIKYELTELLKVQYFKNEVKNTLILDPKEKNNIKQDWKIDGQSYIDYKDEIANLVKKAFQKIELELDINFEDLKLHDKIVAPTCDMCLTSKVSKEDSLVTISCMFPENDYSTNFAGLLSNDGQYFSAFKESKDNIESVFKRYGLNVPHFISTKSLGGKFNIYENEISDDELNQIWQSVILDLINEKNRNSLMGTTYKFGNKGVAGQCIYIDLGEKPEILEHEWITIIPKDLSIKEITIKKEDYWSMGKVITLPYTFESEHKVSFKPKNGEIKPDELELLRENGNLVFYHNED